MLGAHGILEARLIGRVEQHQRDQRHVDVPLDAADVVARALAHDLDGLPLPRLCRIHEQLRQPIAAIAHRFAVYFEDVAKLHVRLGGARRPHEEQIGLQLAMRDKRPVGLVGVLHVALFSHDARQLALVADDVVGDTLEDRGERRVIVRGGRRRGQDREDQRE